MAKKRKKARRPGKNYSGNRGLQAKKKNPFLGFGKKRRRRAKNPLFPTSTNEMIHITGGALVGGIGARAIPENLPMVSQYNNGPMGYALNLITTFALAKLAKAIDGPKAEEGVWVGGILMTAGRVITDNLGKTVITFGSTRLGNDPSFNFRRMAGMGRYQTNNLSPLPVPTTYPPGPAPSPLPVGTHLALPAPAASKTATMAPTTVAAASSMGLMGYSKYGRNRFM